MLRVLFLFFISFSMLFSSAYASYTPICTNKNNFIKCTQGHIKSLNVSGTVLLQGTHIHALSEIQGALTAKHATLNSIAIKGDVDISNSKIFGYFKSSGTLNIYKSKFFFPIITTSTKTIIKNSDLKDVYIKATSAKNEILCLSNSTIDGNIVFFSGNGILLLDQQTKFTGMMLGGAVNKEDFNLYCE